MNDTLCTADSLANKTRDPLRGIMWLYLFGVVAAVGVNPAIKVLVSESVGLGLTVVLLPVGVTVPLLVAVGR